MSTATYTDARVAKLRELFTVENPCTKERAETVASDFGVTARSVISKVVSLGLPYEKATAPAKKKPADTKADVVGEFAELVGASSAEVHGLEKATMAALVAARDLTAAAIDRAVADALDAHGIEPETVADAAAGQ